jgi:hypothetical protein
MLLKKAFWVRKRWDGARVFLIHLTQIVEIDNFSEAAWDRLDGTASATEIVDHLTRLFPNVAADTVEALFAHNVLLFERVGFLADS